MKFLISATYDMKTGETTSTEYAEIPVEVVAEMVHGHMKEIGKREARREPGR